VGRSRYCNYPNAVLALPQVGGYVDPNIEATLALAPTLVTGARGPLGRGFVDRLESLSIATYFPETESVAGIAAMLLGLGDRSGHRHDAEEVVKIVNGRLQATAERLRGRSAPRVLLLYGTNPIVAAGRDSFADAMLGLARATNVVTQGAGYPTMGLEQVVVLDPDIIVNSTFGEGMDNASKLGDRAGWNKVRAVRESRVYELRDDAVLRPGPRVPDGVDALARLIHGI
jgi:iron complex transport system substrate-binding protein